MMLESSELGVLWRDEGRGSMGVRGGDVEGVVDIVDDDEVVENKFEEKTLGPFQTITTLQ